MDFEQNDIGAQSTQPEPPEQTARQAVDAPTEEAARKGTGWRIFWGIILVLSIMANFVLFLMLIGVVMLFATGQKRILTEEVIQAGPRSAKIAVIRLEGIIESEQAKSVAKQLKRAQEDKRVKGVIVRVVSPGGTISGSDQIHRAISQYRDEADKPVVAFMQGVAASGGYYVSVACDHIVAEPTTITGSIGVMFGHFVLEKLLEEKLGIEPVVITAGKRKGWPSMFEPFEQEQQQYIQDKLIDPAFSRFKQVVTEGRPSLTSADVDRLADGSIYWAKEALDEKLIDQLGYLDDAIERVMSLAGIEKAQVVEYRRPFSWSSFLMMRSRSALEINRTTLYELSTPELLYLWTAY